MSDLIVVGGGPAGSSAARLAGKLGLEILLLEKARSPRYRASRGAITEQALSDPDFDLRRELLEAPISAARVRYGSSSIEACGGSPRAVTVSRSALKASLLERAREAGAVGRQPGPRSYAALEPQAVPRMLGSLLAAVHLAAVGNCRGVEAYVGCGPRHSAAAARLWWPCPL
jgi:choline dehydrogenase-like flavoprotein